MADQATSLPVRSEADGNDERLQTKIVDATSPDSQQMEVDADNNAHVEVHGNNPASGDEVLRLSELGHPNSDGLYDGTNNTDPSNTAMIAHSRNASPADTQSTERLTSVENAAGDARSLDIALHDEAGEAYTALNPLPVSFAPSEGAEIVDYDTASAIAKDATDNHDYTVSGGVTFVGKRIWATASGKMKIEVQLETAAASGVFNTRYVAFNSTSNPNIDIQLDDLPQQVTGAIVRVIRTNLDNQAQDLYSTIGGIEV